MIRLPTAALVVLSAGIVACALALAVKLDVQADERPILANVVIESASLTTIAGFQDGQLGDHVTGRLPGALFQDGQDRDLASAYTLSDTRELYLVYAGGAAADWKADLDGVLLELRYQDGRDPLRFTIGGFIEARTGDTLRIAPPGGADWLAAVLRGQCP